MLKYSVGHTTTIAAHELHHVFFLFFFFLTDFILRPHLLVFFWHVYAAA